MLKDPVIIEIDKEINGLDEKTVHKYIIDMVENRFLELGYGFALIGHEYKLTINNKTYKIDLLFYNYELNCFIVIEVKIREINPKDMGQLKFYVKCVDNLIKKRQHKKTEGILIVKKKNKLVVEYATSEDLYTLEYKLIKNSK